MAVGQPVNRTAVPNESAVPKPHFSPRIFRFSMSCASSVVVVVGQPATNAQSRNFALGFNPSRIALRTSNVPPSPSQAAGVFGHPSTEGCDPVDSLSDMRRPDAVCTDNRRPAGVADSFQVCEYSIEPTEASFSRNLFPKDSERASRGDEPEEIGPEMALVGRAFLFARGREGLAGAGTRPDFSVFGPVGETKGERPPADAGEGVELGDVG